MKYSLYGHGFEGLENYQKVINNMAFRLAAKNTVQIMGLGVILLVPLSLLLACIIDNRKDSHAIVWMLSPIMVPAACIVMVWRVLFDSHGIVNQLLIQLGQESILWSDGIYAKIVVLIVYIWKYTGYNIVIFLGALSSIPKEYIEAAQLEGGGKTSIFFKIKLRCIFPAIVFVTMVSILNSFKIFREVYIMTGDYPNDSMYLLSHFFNNTLRKINYQTMSTAAILFSIVMIVLIGTLCLIERYLGKDMER